MPFVYILKSDDDRYYVGSTVDLKARLNHHKGGFTPSTKRMKNVEMIFSQEYDSLRDARIVERKIKKLKRKDYIRKIVEEGVIKMRV